jgi:hypothetical protein
MLGWGVYDFDRDPTTAVSVARLVDRPEAALTDLSQQHKVAGDGLGHD